MWSVRLKMNKPALIYGVCARCGQALACLALVLLLVSPAPAQTKTNSTHAGKKDSDLDNILPGFVSFDEILEQATRNIALRYNLNDEQYRYTENMMKTEVRKFIRDHHDDIGWVLTTIVQSQLNPESLMNDQDKLKRLGQKAVPLFQHAQKAIFDANEEWGQYLTADQKRMHDYDMQEMHRAFGTMETRMQDWAQGKKTDRLFDNVNPPPGQSPPRPSKPAAGVLPRNTKSSETPASELMDTGMWDHYVEAFIRDYHLDDLQVAAARKILAEEKQKARTALSKVDKEIKKAKKKLQNAIIARDRKARAEADEELRGLRKPLDVGFNSLDRRLEAIPRKAQVKAYEARNNPATATASPKKKEDKEPVRASDKKTVASQTKSGKE